MSFIKASIRVGFAELGRYNFSMGLTEYKGSDGIKTHTSTTQLFVLISNTFPPN